MRIILKSFIFILCVSFLVSCSKTPQISSKKVEGSWKLGKMVAAGCITDTNAQKAAVEQPKSPEGNKALKTAMVDAQKGSMDKITNLVPKLKDAMEFNADKSGFLTIHGKTVSGTWKINEKGKTVIFTSADSKETFNISIAKVDNYTMLVDEPSSIGPIRFSYSKLKK